MAQDHETSRLGALREALAGLLGTGAPEPHPAPPLDDLSATLHATCATCGVEVSDQVRAFCLGHPERFGGRVYCYEHQRDLRGADG